MHGVWYCTGGVPSSQPLFTVRQADASDIPVLAYHRAAMFRDMGKLASDQERALTGATAAYLVKALPGGEYLAWLAQETATPAAVIGGAGAQLRPILPRPGTGGELELGPEAIILNVYVELAWRRRGVGEALTRKVLDALVQSGIRRVVLHAAEDGRRLYERLGFVASNEMRLE